MRTLLLLTPALIASGAVPASAFAQAGVDPPQDRYVIQAVVAPDASTIRGTVRISWTNRSQRPVPHLLFHLYLNAFATRDTVFMRESGGQLRGRTLQADGRIELSSLRLAAGHDLLAGADRELVPGDNTQLRAHLPEPCPPGCHLEIIADFTSHMPEIRVRTGITDGFVLGAQFFPKLARLEPHGVWASFPFHAFGEFYADFAHYDLQLAVPPGYLVGATGDRAEPTTPEYPHRFVAHPVHDVAFTAWDRFVVRELTQGATRILFFSPPGYDAAVDHQLPVLARALEYFSEHYGPYPYGTLTAVLPPEDGASGMEYPMFFTSSGPPFSVPGVHVLQEQTAVHELAHQWFQGMVATHEVTWPMLDEGLTTWAHIDFMADQHGLHSSALSWPRLELDAYELMRAWSRNPGLAAPGQPAHGFESSSSYGESVYGLTSITLETVARTWGRARLRAALGDYAQAQRFAHPTPTDLFRVMDDHYWAGFSESVLVPPLMHAERGSVTSVQIHPNDGGSTVTASRTRGPRLPLQVEIRLADGTSTRVSWPGPDREFHHTTLTTPVTWARVDPDGHNLLDPSLLDNVAMVEDHEPPREAVFSRLLGALTTLLGWVGP